MSNYNFDEVLSQFNNNPEEILKKYDYKTPGSILKRINSQNETSELKDIINSIVLWKLNRMVEISNETLLKLSSIRDIENVDAALNARREEVKDLLISLLSSSGVRLAMASTFLHFFNPKVFPIFDQRAYRVIYLKDYKPHSSNALDAELYFDYLQKCEEYYKIHLSSTNIQFSDIDKYLYQLDIEAKNKI